jgi:hypothetical protein
MEEMAKGIAIFFPPNLCRDSGRLWLRHLQTSEGRSSFLDLSHTRYAGSGWNERKRGHGWEGWCS